MTTPDAAVTAAAEALTTGWTGDPPEAWALTIARTAVAAARPIIEAEQEVRIATLRQALGNAEAVHRQTLRDWANDRDVWEAEVRERIAAEIEAARDATSPTAFKYRDGLTDAARIVRGTA